MNKNRIGYLVLMACLAVLVFLFSNRFLLFLLIMMVVLAVLMAALSRVDARNMLVDMEIVSGTQEGKDLKVKVKMYSRFPLYAARSILMGVDIENTMFCSTERKYYFMYLSGKSREVELTIPARRCGEVKIQCAEILLQDLLKLFRRKIRPFETVQTIVYPRSVNVHVEMSRATIGAPREEGRMQNRKGNDPSEMFDIREYVPGDDIRLVHWKLSSKTENLILREASDPSHYNMVLLPDLGRKVMNIEAADEHGEPQENPVEEINTAVAFGTAIGEQLLRLGCAFCMAVPGKNGLQLCEVRDRRDLQRMLMLWMSSPIPEYSGQALQYFITEHLEEYFTRLLILSAGVYQQNLNTLSGQIGTTVVSARADLDTVISSVSGSCEMTDIPVDKTEEMYRIIC